MKKPTIKKSNPRINLQIGAGFDIPNATFVTGKRGETLVTGAMMNSIGILGPADSYKSTTAYYIALTIMNRYGGDNPYTLHYDTEVNTNPERINNFGKEFPNLEQPVTEHSWDITDKSQYYADEFIPIVREFIESRKKEKLIRYDAYGINILQPVNLLIDSMSMFEPKSTAEMLEKQKMEDGKTNTYYMKQGSYKDKFIGEIPTLTAKGNLKFITTAHIGKKIAMDNPYAPKETKQMGFLKEGEYIKGVSPKFMYLMNSIWYNHTATVLKNKSTKLPEYPLASGLDEQATDLMLVRTQPLKSKSGANGYIMPLIFSQREGLLVHLSAYHYLKTNECFGIQGCGSRNFSLVLLPDISLSRITIREKIKKNHRLQRALEILRDLHQLKVFHPQFVQLGLWLEPSDLYNKIIELGYNWDDLLDTIEYPPLDSYNENYKPHLSVVDLLYMVAGKYRPYWLEDRKGE